MCYFSYSTVERQSVLFMQIASLTGVQIVECGEVRERDKYVGREGEGERFLLSLTPYPTPSLFFLLTSLTPSPPSEHLDQVILQITLGL